MTRHLLPALVGLLVLAGCHAVSKAQKPAPSAPGDLEGTWVAVQLSGKRLEAHPSGKILPYLRFSTAETKLGGNTGCNIITGRYQLKGSKLTVPPLAVTRRLCHDAPFEKAMLEALQPGEYGIALEKDTLMLIGTGGSPSLFVKQMTAPSWTKTVTGSWKGLLPCADCQGIAYAIDIRENQTFNSSMQFLGKHSQPYTTNGSWKIYNDSTIQLIGTNTQTQLIRPVGDTLYWLDSSGSRVNTALANQYRLSRGQLSPDQINYAAMEKATPGIFFTAKGNEPFWALDFTREHIRFSRAGADTVFVPMVEPVQAMDAPVQNYRVQTEAGDMSITLTTMPCTDDMSGAGFTHQVRVTYRRGVDKEPSEYTGCGRFIPDPRLNDIWLLERIGNTKLDRNKKLPIMELHLNENRMLGTTGCNNLNTTIRVEGQTILVGAIRTTRKTCPDTYEAQFLSALPPGKYQFSLENGNLVLQRRGQPSLYFRKID